MKYAGKDVRLKMRIPVRIKLSAHDLESISRFEHSVENILSIKEGYAVSGAEDYLLFVSAKDIIEFDIIHRHILANLPGVSTIKFDLPLRQIQ